MTEKFTNLVAIAKRAAVAGILNRGEIEGLMRRAETLGLDQPEAERIIARTDAAKRVDMRSGEAV